MNCFDMDCVHDVADQMSAGVAVTSYEAAFSSTHQSNVLALVAGAQWNDSVITYSFPDAAEDYITSGQSLSDYGSGEAAGGFAEFTTAQQDATRSIFEMYGNLLGVTFVEETGASDEDAMIRLGQSGVPSTAWAYYPSASALGGDVWLGTGAGYYTNPAVGSYAYHTLMHEIGHALGLKHGHDSSGNGALSADKDSMEYSFMTYHSHEGSTTQTYTNEYWGYAQSAMQYDIAALQALYGVNDSYNVTDTEYTFSSTTGAMSINGVAQDAPGSNRIFTTLWDGGGWDVVSLKNFNQDTYVDLSEGGHLSFSSIQTAQLQAGIYSEANVFLSLDPGSNGIGLIEEVKTGAGDDEIHGNQVKNVLHGKGGSDVIYGGGGGDVIRGNAGADEIYGGDGVDRLHGGLGRDILTGGDGADFFILKENSNVDRIRDFELGVDRIKVENQGLLSLDSNAQGHLVVDYGSNGARFVLQQLDLGDATIEELLLIA